MFVRIAHQKMLWKAVNLCCAVAFLWSMTGCGWIQELEKSGGTPEDAPADKFDFVKKNRQQTFVDNNEKQSEEIGERGKGISADEISAKAETLPSLSRENPDAKPVKRKPAPRFYEDFIMLDGDEELDVKLTFNATPLVDTLPAFADILGFNFTSDPDIKTNVTLNIHSRMTRRELWENFDDMLRLAGCGAVKSGQMLKVMLQAKIPAQSELRAGSTGDGSTAIINRTMLNVVSRDAAGNLRPFLTKAGTVVDIAKTNTVLLCDDQANIPKLKEILDLIDQPSRSRWPSTLLHCKNVKPSRMVDELTMLLPVLGLSVTQAADRAESPGSVRLSGVDRLELLAVSAANQEMLDQLKSWVDILDNSSEVEQERLYVYKVAHGKARQLAQALTAIFSTQGTSLTVDTSTGNNRTEQLNSQATRQLNQSVTSSNRDTTNLMPNTQIDRSSSIFDTPVRIFADGVHNRLVVRTTPRAYAMVKAMLDRLDVVPSQVLLQIMIVEIQLNDTNEFGLDFSTMNTGGGNVITTGADFIDPTSTTVTGGNGFTLGIADADNPNDQFAKIRAMAGRENIKVISSPQIVISSNREAKIQVGENVPILLQDQTNSASSTGNVTRSYSYEETGILLTITPQVTSKDLITLELEQQVSEARTNDITTASDTPVINMRRLNTGMTIANGQTMVIGGIIQERNVDTIASVPLIADIPFLRRLFGNTAQAVKRTEMLVLITGYIINEKSPVEEMVRRYNNSVRSLSIFERKLEKEHEQDMERLKKLQELQKESASGKGRAPENVFDNPDEKLLNPAEPEKSSVPEEQTDKPSPEK